MINHRVGNENKAVDALSQLTVTFHRIGAYVIGFDRLKDEYSICPDFSIIYDEVSNVTVMNTLTFLLKMVICLK